MRSSLGATAEAGESGDGHPQGAPEQEEAVHSCTHHIASWLNGGTGIPHEKVTKSHCCRRSEATVTKVVCGSKAIIRSRRTEDSAEAHQLIRLRIQTMSALVDRAPTCWASPWHIAVTQARLTGVPRTWSQVSAVRRGLYCLNAERCQTCTRWPENLVGHTVAGSTNILEDNT